MSSRCPSSKMPKRASIASALQCVGCVCARTHVPNPHPHAHMPASTSINTCINQVRPAHISLVRAPTHSTLDCAQKFHTHTHTHTHLHAQFLSLSLFLSRARARALSLSHTHGLTRQCTKQRNGCQICPRTAPAPYQKCPSISPDRHQRLCLTPPPPTHNPHTLTSQCL